MLFPLLTLISALFISFVAAYYSIIGLVSLFSGAALAVIIMGIALELGKVVTATWLHKNWTIAPLFLKTYLTIATVVLMFITSMGIFGYLSKAHIEQTGSLNEITNQIDKINFDIDVEQTNIEQENKKIVASQRIIDQLDKSMEIYFEKGNVKRALKERNKQQQERLDAQKNIDQTNNNIRDINQKISVFSKQKFDLAQKIKSYEIEVGPVKYIAELFYGKEKAQSLLDQTIRYVIITLIFVFDPLAILLILAANISFKQYQEEKNKKQQINKDTINSWVPKPEETKVVQKQPIEIYTKDKTKDIKTIDELVKNVKEEWEKIQEENRKKDFEINVKLAEKALDIAESGIMKPEPLVHEGPRAYPAKKEEQDQIRLLDDETILAIPGEISKNKSSPPTTTSREDIAKVIDNILKKMSGTPQVPYNLTSGDTGDYIKKNIADAIEEEINKKKEDIE